MSDIDLDRDFTAAELVQIKQYARNILDSIVEELEEEASEDPREGAVVAYAHYVAAMNFLAWWQEAERKVALRQITNKMSEYGSN